MHDESLRTTTSSTHQTSGSHLLVYLAPSAAVSISVSKMARLSASEDVNATVSTREDLGQRACMLGKLWVLAID